MRMDCEVIRDLLPLYVERMAGKKSAELVEEHLAECEECRSLHGKMAARDAFEAEQGEEEAKVPLVGVRRQIFLKKLRLALFFALAVYAVLLTVYGHLTKPVYLSVEEAQPDFYVDGGGALVMRVQTSIAGHGVTTYEDEMGLTVAEVEVWTSALQGKDRSQTTTIVIAEQGGDVDAVYYLDYTKTENMIFAYGTNPNPNGGGMVMSRSVLGFYSMVMLAAAAVLGVLAFVFRKNGAGKVLLALFFLPVCYLAAQCLLCVGPASYAPQREFALILAVCAGLYGMALLGMRMYRDSNRYR